MIKTSGIYKIINTLNSYFYIGSSKNIEKRFYTHLNKLKNNKHDNIYLQRSYNKYGNVFECEILEVVSCEDDLLKVEQEYLDKYYDDEKNYNIGRFSSGGDNISKHPNRDEIIEKLREIGKKIFLNNTNHPFFIIKKGNMNPNYNNKWSFEMKKKMSKNKLTFFKTHNNPLKDKKLEDYYDEEKVKIIKKKISDSAKIKIGIKNSFYGKKHTDETKKHLKDIRIGKYYGSQNKVFYIDDVEYNTLSEASKKLNIHITTISWRLRSKNKKFDNYKYKLEHDINL